MMQIWIIIMLAMWQLVNQDIGVCLRHTWFPNLLLRLIVRGGIGLIGIQAMVAAMRTVLFH